MGGKTIKLNISEAFECLAFFMALQRINVVVNLEGGVAFVL